MTATVPKIAIIGAGASGCAAARTLQLGASTNHFTVLEAADSIGGVWKYDLSSSDRKPMYRSLRTNLPKEVMNFREAPWYELCPDHTHSFVSHEQVLTYLQKYCHHFDLMRNIQFHCHVKQLSIIADTRSAVCNCQEESWPKLKLEWQQGADNEEYSDEFDAVFVCNGHYNAPRYPEIEGFDRFYQGMSMHSMKYDIPDAFQDKTVLCIGGRASGSDIAREIASLKGKTKVILSDSSTESSVVVDNITWVPRTTKVLPDGSFIFKGTPEPVHGIDSVIFCSGYDYSFPFINERSGIDLDSSHRRVKPLLDQLWHAKYPNIAFIGLPHSVVPFPLFELQAAAVERSWSHSILPNDTTRIKLAMLDAESGGANKARVPYDTHYLGSAQWDYCRQMAEMAGILDPALEKFIETNKVRTSNKE